MDCCRFRTVAGSGLLQVRGVLQVWDCCRFGIIAGSWIVAVSGRCTPCPVRGSLSLRERRSGTKVAKYAT